MDDRDVTQVIRTWLEHPVSLSRSGLDAALDRAGSTDQLRRRSWRWRFGMPISSASGMPTTAPPRVLGVTVTRRGAVRSGTWRTSYGFVPLVVAVAVLVALGGAVLALVRPGPRLNGTGESISATQSVARSPATPEGLLSRLVTRQVEPGVLQVLGDGIRDFDLRPFDWANRTAIGPDGTIWMVEQDRFFKVGEAQAWTWTDTQPDPPFLGGEGQPPFPEWAYRQTPDFVVAPDGSLWSSDRQFDGTAWEMAWSLRVLGFEPDGTLWTVSDGGDRWLLTSKDSDGLRVFSDSVEGSAAVMPDGTVWLAGLHRQLTRLRPPLDDPSSVSRETVTPVSVTRDNEWTELVVGSDGSLWVYYGATGDADDALLARLTGDDWTVWSRTDGVPDMGYEMWPTSIAVGPDGTIWLTPRGDFEATGSACDGIASFDGTSWARYLKGRCIVDIDVAPDGTVWVQTDETGKVLPADHRFFAWSGIRGTFIIPARAVQDGA